MSVEAEVVVIGMARVGKSYVGNCFEREDAPEETFQTKEGIESCTSGIKSVLFKKVEVPGTGKAVDLRYTDTPGFPDSDPENSVLIFDNIVEYINDKRPEAIIWVINPSKKDPEDGKLYNRFSLLMKEFKKTGIFRAVLINNQGSKRQFGSMSKKKKAKSAYATQISGYGIENFTNEDHIYYSYYDDLLKEEVLKIVCRAIVSESSHGKARTFEDIRSEYEGHFLQSTLENKYGDSLKSDVAQINCDISYHKETIEDLNTAMAGTPAGAGAIGVGLAFFSFGLSDAAGATVALISNVGMLFAKQDSEKKIRILNERKEEKERKLQSLNLEDPMKFAKKEFGEFCTILKALKLTDELEKLKLRFRALTN